MQIIGLKLFKNQKGSWINMPDREYEDNGERKWAPIVKFTSDEVKKAFLDKVMDALRTYAMQEQAAPPPPAPTPQAQAYAANDDLPF